MFSPDARFIASASFDKSIKLWCGRTGKFIDSLRGHVQAVYRIAWSSDSRLLVSGSADSTLKVCRFHLYSPLCERLSWLIPYFFNRDNQIKRYHFFHCLNKINQISLGMEYTKKMPRKRSTWP